MNGEVGLTSKKGSKFSIGKMKDALSNISISFFFPQRSMKWRCYQRDTCVSVRSKEASWQIEEKLGNGKNGEVFWSCEADSRTQLSLGDRVRVKSLSLAVKPHH